MSDRIISFANGVTKDFGVRADLLSDTTLSANGFSIDFYISNGAHFQFSREDVSNDSFTIAAAAYGVEQRVKSATNLSKEARTVEKITELVEKTLANLANEGWSSVRSSGAGSVSKPSNLELAFLAVEGNTKEAWDALSTDEKRNICATDPEVNAEYKAIQANIAREKAKAAKAAKEAAQLEEAA